MLSDQRPDMRRDHHDDPRGQDRRDRPVDEIERRLTRAMDEREPDFHDAAQNHAEDDGHDR